MHENVKMLPALDRLPKLCYTVNEYVRRDFFTPRSRTVLLWEVIPLKKMNRSVRSLCLAAMIAALYLALTLLFQPISFGAVQLLAPQIVHAFLGDENPALNLSSVDALRRYGLCYLMVGFNVLMGGFLTAVERPRPAICISVGRGLALQAGALLLAAVWGGSVIWFAPVISEALCLVMALVFMTRFWRKIPDTVQV